MVEGDHHLRKRPVPTHDAPIGDDKKKLGFQMGVFNK